MTNLLWGRPRFFKTTGDQGEDEGLFDTRGRFICVIHWFEENDTNKTSPISCLSLVPKLKCIGWRSPITIYLATHSRVSDSATLQISSAQRSPLTIKYIAEVCHINRRTPVLGKKIRVASLPFICTLESSASLLR